MTDLAHKRDRLLASIGSLGRCAVAYSGGVDSAVVAQAAQLALGKHALAITGASESLAEGELEAATQLAARIGIRHRVLHTSELANSAYTRNAVDRCYHCKSELYTQIAAALAEEDIPYILNGANLDDRGDYRPGLTAAAEHQVRSPLAECELTKAEVRQLAAEWELPVAEKPATPCLSSRIAYGEEVTPERLRMIDRAEQYLRQLGLAEVRVRYHRGDLARLEVPPAAIARLAEDKLRAELVRRLGELGFRFVTLDLAGFRSGSLNSLVPLEQLTRSRSG